ncbi:MAG: S4 domain-containing protein [Candidatus Latescibacteria bacterium]|nr:S4 domain-containing protein [Candidatus Latescibacterota bacterium]
MTAPEAQQMRLNRFLARCGIASRRRSDELIQSGVIRINGEVVDEPGRGGANGADQVACQGRAVVRPHR